jgi:hypothetical protein
LSDYKHSSESCHFVPEIMGADWRHNFNYSLSHMTLHSRRTHHRYHQVTNQIQSRKIIQPSSASRFMGESR